ncbi:MAG: alpha-L-fucosidase [Armatimonadetes bacterium]|nr:alpha-L-fucosidase [Armatimonadota bacterium]MDE2207332.1 alpha-L-fucosidase [Armatimonadota bacterium]
MKLRSLAACAFCLAALPVVVQAQQLMVNPNTGETQQQFARRTAWWRKAKFGMFIHWGIYSVPADSRHGAAEWYFSNEHMQVKDYEKFAPLFNPVDFNAAAWVKVAKDAGMKYMVITSKHHDGFCMFNTKYTNYNIVKATPFHHDPMKDLSAAARRQGLTFCFYYSIMDWHNPEYLPRRSWDVRSVGKASLDTYIHDYLEPQLRELLTNYGPIGIIWFDGGWEHTGAQLHSQEINRLIRSIQPKVMINDRDHEPQDYSTPEQTIPANALPNGRLWETCMTMNNTWGYSANDHDFKSAPDLIRKLCDIASKGGNFLLNVGPDSLGRIPQEEVDRLEAIGRWMKVNGDSIYGTTKSPWTRPQFDGRCTTKGSNLYLQVFNWPEGGLKLQGLQTHVKGVSALADGDAVRFLQVGDLLTIDKPSVIDPTATVLQVRLAGAPVVTEVLPQVQASADGSFSLSAADATLGGPGIQLESHGGIQNIGYWSDSQDQAKWLVHAETAGKYQVQIEWACDTGDAGNMAQIQAVGKSGAAHGLQVSVPDTGGWDTFATATLPGSLSLEPGENRVSLSVAGALHGALMNVRVIRLIPSPSSR